MSNPKSPQQPTPSKRKRSAAKPVPETPSPATSAHTSVPDTVAGDPPVPITAWYLPRPRSGTTVPATLVRRLIANYTQPGTPVLNLSAGSRALPPQSPPASLIITDWPRSARPKPGRLEGDRSDKVNSEGQAGVREHLGVCAGQLTQGGCLAVVVTTRDIPELLGVLVQAARTTGLRYLQHIVVVHQVKPRRNEPRPAEASSQSLRAHTDVLLFIQPAARTDAPTEDFRAKARGGGRRPRV